MEKKDEDSCQIHMAEDRRDLGSMRRSKTVIAFPPLQLVFEVRADLVAVCVPALCRRLLQSDNDENKDAADFALTVPLALHVALGANWGALVDLDDWDLSRDRPEVNPKRVQEQAPNLVRGQLSCQDRESPS